MFSINTSMQNTNRSRSGGYKGIIIHYDLRSVFLSSALTSLNCDKKDEI